VARTGPKDGTANTLEITLMSEVPTPMATRAQTTGNRALAKLRRKAK
jgi:hypothetical protein